MSTPLLIDTPGGINVPPSNSPYEGYFYAFYGSGGFTMDQCFNTIKLTQPNPLLRYDVTKALQVKFDVRTFNAKLGLYKDDNNIGVTATTFNPVTDNFSINEITITADEFVYGMSEQQVISVGSYSTMYSDFKQLVNTYFGYAGGFSSLFSQASEFDINHGVFDASAFLNIITPYSKPSGENVKQVTGAITISDINSLLKYAIDRNIFGNRTSQSSVGTSSDVSSNYTGNSATQEENLFKSNYGMADGFIAGDLIFIPAGTTIKLHLDIDSENFNPLNNIGPTNVSELIGTMDTTRTFTSQFYPDNGSGPVGPYDMMIDETNQFDNNGDPIEGSVVVGTKKIFTEKTTASTTNIDRVLTAPLLILLDNLSTTSSLQPGQIPENPSDLMIAASASANAARVSANAANASAIAAANSAEAAATSALQTETIVDEASTITSTATGVSEALALLNTARDKANAASSAANDARDVAYTARDLASGAATLAAQNAKFTSDYALANDITAATEYANSAKENADTAYNAARSASTSATLAQTNNNKAEAYHDAAQAAFYTAQAAVLASSVSVSAIDVSGSFDKTKIYYDFAVANSSTIVDDNYQDVSNYLTSANTLAANAIAAAIAAYTFAQSAAAAAEEGDTINAIAALNNADAQLLIAQEANSQLSAIKVSAVQTAATALAEVIDQLGYTTN